MRTAPLPVTEDTAQPPLLERAPALAVIDRALDRVATTGTALLVCGEPGIGKTAVLASAARRAQVLGLRCLRAAGVESEAHVAYAGLHQLLRPILRRKAEPKQTLVTAFGAGDVAAPGLFRVALATLDLLADAAAETPLVLLVDDAQWLDEATLDVLAFVARRLEADPVVLLAAARDGVTTPLHDAGLERVTVARLSPAAAAALLDATARDLDPARRAAILAAAAGNPLALVELPRTPASGPSPARLTERLERAFAARLDELPPAARSLLVVAAVDDGDDLEEILEAGARLVGTPADLDDLQPALDARLVTLDGTRLRFRHPLVRSAVVQASGRDAARAAHRALAAALAGDGPREVWHRAAAVRGTDDATADELERHAAAARADGLIAMAARAYERAAELASAPGPRGSRLVHAAELALDLGRTDDARRLADRAGRLTLRPLDASRLAWLGERLAHGYHDPGRVPAFLDILERVRDEGDPRSALDGLLAVAIQLWWDPSDGPARERLLAAAERFALAPSHPLLLTILATGAPSRHAAAVLARLTHDRDEDPVHAVHRAAAALACGALDLAERENRRAAEGFRADGRLGRLAQALLQGAWCAIHLGHVKAGTVAVAEGARLAAETAQPVWVTSAALQEAVLAAQRGDPSRLAAIDEAAPLAPPPLVAVSRGLAALSLGRGEEAFAHLDALFADGARTSHAGMRGFVVAELAEAAVQTGREAQLRERVPALEALAARTRSPVLERSLAYAHALLAAPEHAEPAFQAALELDLAHWPSLRARTLLAYGAWLRRRRRVAESRVPLRTALALFEECGDRPRAERVAQELRASGERPRDRSPESWDRLTPQELQIAELAASGLSNREIGQRLFISARTVSTHLYRAFPKLGVSSRTELRDALGVQG